MTLPFANPFNRDQIPFTLGYLITLLVAAATLTPYLREIPRENMNLITQANTTLWNGWMLMLGYFYGTSAQQKKTNDTMNLMAQNAAPSNVPPIVAVVNNDNSTVAPPEKQP
jgi:hypothetical protein